MTKPLTVYIASSFKNYHGVQLLVAELKRRGIKVHDWTRWQKIPEGLNAEARRKFMDTDEGKAIYKKCRNACLTSDIVIHYGPAGNDAGIEIGLADGAGRLILGLLGPNESPGLMLNGSVSKWCADTDALIKEVITIAFQRLREQMQDQFKRAFLDIHLHPGDSLWSYRVRL